jgi:integrase
MSTLYKRARSKYYWWTGRLNGKRLRKSTGMTQKHRAEKVKAHFDIQIALGNLDGLGFTEKKLSLLEFINYYLNLVSERKSDSTFTITKGVLKKFKAYIVEKGIKSLTDIKVRDINGYIDWLECSPKTKKNHVNILSLMFDEAIRDEKIKSNPSRLAMLPKVEKVLRHRPLNDADLSIIFANAGEWILYYTVLLHTGLRAGDAAMLTYDNIDFSRSIIKTLVRKSRRIHELPISDHLITMLKQSKVNGGPLFPTLYATRKNSQGELIPDERILHYRISIPRKHLQNILKDANLPKATLHSFRVTFNNLLLAENLAIEDRKSLMAHSSSNTTSVYTHPNLELAREYINKLPTYSSEKKRDQGVTKV